DSRLIVPPTAAGLVRGAASIRPRLWSISSLMNRLGSWLRALSPLGVFVGIASLAFAASALRTAGTNWTRVAGAAALAVAVGAVAALASRSGAVAFSLVLALALAVDIVIALLREAQGGATSGYAPLAILPVAWVGLTQTRRAVAGIALSTG